MLKQKNLIWDFYIKKILYLYNNKNSKKYSIKSLRHYIYILLQDVQHDRMSLTREKRQKKFHHIWLAPLLSEANYNPLL